VWDLAVFFFVREWRGVARMVVYLFFFFGDLVERVAVVGLLGASPPCSFHPPCQDLERILLLSIRRKGIQLRACHRIGTQQNQSVRVCVIVPCSIKLTRKH